MKPAQILHVDDHPVFCFGLAQIINDESDMQICGHAKNIGDAIRMIEDKKPDLAIVDINLEGRNGIDLIKEISSNWSGIKTLVVSMHDEEMYEERSYRNGAKGYVQKDSPPEEIVKAIRAILNGKEHWSSAMVEVFTYEEFDIPHKHEKTINQILADREFEIFEMIGKGYKPKDIANELCLSVNTVERHRSNIRQKLNIKSSAELTKKAIEWIHDHAHH